MMLYLHEEIFFSSGDPGGCVSNPVCSDVLTPLVLICVLCEHKGSTPVTACDVEHSYMCSSPHLTSRMTLEAVVRIAVSQAGKTSLKYHEEENSPGEPSIQEHPQETGSGRDIAAVMVYM